jgi:hypothetical protein
MKWNKKYQKKIGLTTAAAKDLPPALGQAILRTCRRTYRALGLSGYARLDLRLSADGAVHVIEANPNPNLEAEEDFAASAKAAGLPVTDGALPEILMKLSNVGKASVSLGAALSPAPVRQRARAKPADRLALRGRVKREAFMVGRWLEVSVTHGLAGVRAVDIFVAAGAPACAVLDAGAVVLAAHKEDAVSGDCGMFKMAPQAEVVVAGDQHFLVHRAVGVMADGATLDHGVVLEEEWTLLSRMAFGARLVLILQVGPGIHDDVALVRVVTVAARDVAGEHLVGVRQAELAALVEMALKAGLRGGAGIDDRAAGTARVYVD